MKTHERVHTYTHIHTRSRTHIHTQTYAHSPSIILYPCPISNTSFYFTLASEPPAVPSSLGSPRSLLRRSWFRMPRTRSAFLRARSVISDQLAMRDSVPSSCTTKGPR